MRVHTLQAGTLQQLWTHYIKIEFFTGGDAVSASPHFFGIRSVTFYKRTEGGSTGERKTKHSFYSYR